MAEELLPAGLLPDALRAHDHWAVHGRRLGRLGGILFAIHDLIGKTAGLPASKLFDAQAKNRIQQSWWSQCLPPDSMASEAQRGADLGYRTHQDHRVLRLTGLVAIAALVVQGQVPVAVIETPMQPPEWALLQREVLDANSRAVEAFAAKYIDDRGHLLHTPRWGTLDGPDDAIETYYNWTLLHALGGSETVLDLYRKGLEGHLAQYGELRTELTLLASQGAYEREFITQSDWFHTGEGMRGFLLYGLSDPEDPVFVDRMRRFASMYMGHDPLAPNYDPVRKVIKSLWTGSQGPMLRKATTYDWVGDPVPGRFHILHSPQGRGSTLDLEAWYPRMLAHCDEYLDSVGDHPLNMGATLLGLNAYMLTGETRYREWVLEYIDAWAERTEKAGGMIPTNVGLDGEPGGEYAGQWWKGTYGWNFTIFDGEIQRVAHRNTVTSGAWPGFSNAYLLTGDSKYIHVLRRQIDILYDHKKTVDGRTLLPQMYGDPKGYGFRGEPEFYHFTTDLLLDRLTEIYLWSMDRLDLSRIPRTEGWVAFLEGADPGYPVRALRQDLEYIRGRVERMRRDPTTAETRLADWLLGIVPSTTDHLTQLTIGGYFSRGKLWALHSRLRYFDPALRRAGLPEHVAALVENLTNDSVTVTLVNLDPVSARSLVVQAGGYREHEFTSLREGDRIQELNSSALRIELAPGAGARIVLSMRRYANPPTLVQPWAAWTAEQ